MTLLKYSRCGGNVALLALSILLVSCAGPTSNNTVPITTNSEEARELYLKGRDLLEKLRFTDAREFYSQAVAKDDGFAMAHVGMANTSTTGTQFFDSLRRAVALADQVSEGERHWILGLEAGTNSDPALQKELYTKLTEMYPDDARAHNLLGTYYAGVQDTEAAVEHYTMATKLAPDFSTPYNALGYALRALERYDGAEKAFKKYIELIPDEPNPYDSYAEFLMKRGRFDESIAQYEEALSRNRNFVASYVGIANNQIFLGKYEEARQTLERLTAVARNSGERRTAMLWTAASYLYAGDHNGALKQVEQMIAASRGEDDMTTLSGDLSLMGTILLDEGSPKAALAKYDEAVEVMQGAGVSADVLAANRRNHMFNATRVALKSNDIGAAKKHLEAYRSAVDERKVPFEVRRAHQLEGMIAFAEKRYDDALEALAGANQRNPQVLYLLAQVHEGLGNVEQAREYGSKAENFNGLNLNYAYVRNKAQQFVAAAP